MNRAEAAQLALDDANPVIRAKASLQAGDPSGARHYLEIARIRHPAYFDSSLDAIDVLIGLKEFEQAEAMCLRVMKAEPGALPYAERFATIAHLAGRTAEAVERWAKIRKSFAQCVSAYFAAAGCLREVGRLDEADRLAAEAARRWPEDVRGLIEYARVAEARADWEAAFRRWDTVRPLHPAGVIGCAHALMNLGDAARAEELLAEGRRRWPLESGIAALQARLAERAGDMPEALRRWRVVRTRFPREHGGYREELRLLRTLGGWEEFAALAAEALARFPGEQWARSEHALAAQRVPAPALPLSQEQGSPDGA